MVGRDGISRPGRDTASIDALQQALIPCYQPVLDTVAELLRDWGAPARPRVLDLGTGGGCFAFDLRSQLPYAHFHLVDVADGGPADSCLDVARRRFTGDARVSFATVDAKATDDAGNGWARAVGEGQPWDLVVSFVALHRLGHEAKRALFAAVLAGLAGGGLFIDVEQVLGPTLAAQARYERRWQRDAQAKGAGEAEVSHARALGRTYSPATLDDHLAWLRDAGFTDVDCAFKAWRYAVFSARKG